jgi:hypothetical protein
VAVMPQVVLDVVSNIRPLCTDLKRRSHESLRVWLDRVEKASVADEAVSVAMAQVSTTRRQGRRVRFAGPTDQQDPEVDLDETTGHKDIVELLKHQLAPTLLHTADHYRKQLLKAYISISLADLIMMATDPHLLEIPSKFKELALSSDQVALLAVTVGKPLQVLHKKVMEELVFAVGNADPLQVRELLGNIVQQTRATDLA